MIFTETPLKGAYIIDLEKKEDARGFFARVFCVNQFKEHNLDHNIVQMNNSLTKEKLTLRGMHYQLPPKDEVRIVRCLHGKLFDMILDLRPKSPTFGQSFGTELTPENRRMTYIPKGFAHGFLTLEENTEMLYMVTEFYSPELERVIRWDDPKFNMQWPEKPLHLSNKDANQADFDKDHHLKGMHLL